MQILLYLLLLLTFLPGGKEEAKPTRGGNDPVNQLAWLREETDKIKAASRCDTVCCASGMWRASFQKETVFVFGVNNDANLGNIVCNGLYPVYSCAGDSLGTLGSRAIREVQDRTLVWSSR